MNCITSQGGKHGIQPFTIEFLIGVLLSSGNISNCHEKGKLEDTMQAWKLGDELVKSWAGNIYYSNLSEKDSDEVIAKKMFVSSMKSNYGLTRGYSWYRKIEERHISGIFDGFNNEVEKMIGFLHQKCGK